MEQISELLMKHSSVCVIIFNDSILLLKRSGTDLWCLPGGKTEPNEEPLQTAIRETFEETGITVNTPTYVSTEISTLNPQYYVNIYYSTVLNEPQVVLSKEHSDYAWVKIDEMSNVNFAGKTRSFINSVISTLQTV